MPKRCLATLGLAFAVFAPAVRAEFERLMARHTPADVLTALAWLQSFGTNVGFFLRQQL